MRFEWSSAKNVAKIRKHCIDYADARRPTGLWRGALDID